MATHIIGRASLGLVVALGVACGSSAGHATRPAPKITVIERGAEPRQRLRYDPVPGLVEDVEIRSKMRITNAFTNTTLDTGQRSIDLPTITTRGRLRVTGRSPEGHALVSFAVEDVRTLEDVVDPAMRKLADTQVRRWKDARVTYRLAPTGELADVRVEMPSAPDASHAQVAELQDSVDGMFLQFPEADLGVGAIWQIESQTTSNGVMWIRKATYTLRAVTDGQAIVDVSVAMRAPPQDLRVEPNATTTLKSGTGTLQGQATVPRHGLVGASSAAGTTEASYAIVRRHLRILSTILVDTTLSLTRIGPNVDRPEPSPPSTDPP